jgi:hypothetical protein
MTTDFRALCSELTFCWSRTTNPDDFSENAAPIIERMNAALAQPEPQGPGPDDVTQLYYKHGGGDGMYGGMGEVNFEEAVEEAVEEALARWGRPAIEPVPVSERLPGPEDCLGRPWEGTDAGFCWWFYPGLDGWRLMMATRWEGGIYQNWTPPSATHWLPHWALPVPSSNFTNIEEK